MDVFIEIVMVRWIVTECSDIILLFDKMAPAGPTMTAKLKLRQSPDRYVGTLKHCRPNNFSALFR
jgi:hypothetical protein